MAIRKNFQHFQRFFGAFAPPCARTVPRAFCLFPKKISPAGQTLHIVWRFACRSGRAVRPHCAVRLPRSRRGFASHAPCSPAGIRDLRVSRTKRTPVAPAGVTGVPRLRSGEALHRRCKQNTYLFLLSHMAQQTKLPSCVLRAPSGGELIPRAAFPFRLPQRAHACPDGGRKTRRRGSKGGKPSSVRATRAPRTRQAAAFRQNPAWRA